MGASTVAMLRLIIRALALSIFLMVVFPSIDTLCTSRAFSVEINPFITSSTTCLESLSSGEPQPPPPAVSITIRVLGVLVIFISGVGWCVVDAYV